VLRLVLGDFCARGWVIQHLASMGQVRRCKLCQTSENSKARCAIHTRTTGRPKEIYLVPCCPSRPAAAAPHRWSAGRHRQTHVASLPRGSPLWAQTLMIKWPGHERASIINHSVATLR
jgi:hypothetical protein